MTETDKAISVSELLKNISVNELPVFEMSMEGGPARMRALLDEIEVDWFANPGRRYRIVWDSHCVDGALTPI